MITGVSGLLGSNLAHYLRDRHRVLGLYFSHPVSIGRASAERCDVTEPDALGRVISQFEPEFIIHCASLTNVDECEKKRALAEKTNVASTGNVIEIALRESIKVVYISTDAVYAGTGGDCSEEDVVKPQNYYGHLKLKGELEALRKEDSIVLRTNFFGWNVQEKNSLGEWILDQLEARRRINCFKDAHFSSMYTLELSRTIDMAIRNGLSGVYNCGSSDSCSKYQFAVMIAERFGLDKSLITPISIDDSGLAAPRGKNLSLNVEKLQRDLDYWLPTVEQSVESFYRDYKCGLRDEIKRYRREKSGRPAFIPYGRHMTDENDVRAVSAVLRTERITQGTKVREFEDALADYAGARHAVVFSSGTAALHAAYYVAGVAAEDEVVTSPLTFVATSNAALMLGARPVFFDIESDTGNLNASRVETAVGSGAKAIVPVHYSGHPANMERLHAVARKNGAALIEDACHALGAGYKGEKVGCCRYSDMAVFSFHPVKLITTGEGGAVLTNDEELYEKLLMFRTHGITRENFTNDADGHWYYEMRFLGYNYRMTDIQAALGISQMGKIESFVQRRRDIVNAYNDAFEGNPYFDVPIEKGYAFSACHLYFIRLRDRLRDRKGKIFDMMTENGLGVQVHYMPVYLQPYYRDLGYEQDQCPQAEDFYRRVISIPIFPAMTDEEVAYVIDTVLRVLEDADKG